MRSNLPIKAVAAAFAMTPADVYVEFARARPKIHTTELAGKRFVDAVVLAGWIDRQIVDADAALTAATAAAADLRAKLATLRDARRTLDRGGA